MSEVRLQALNDQLQVTSQARRQVAGTRIMSRMSRRCARSQGFDFWLADRTFAANTFVDTRARGVGVITDYSRAASWALAGGLGSDLILFPLCVSLGKRLI